jgi:hypothetical protein
VDEGFQLVFQQNTLGESHLVHGPVDVEELHLGGALTDLMQFSVLVAFEESGFAAPDWFFVDVELVGFPVAVSPQHCLQAEQS